MNPRGVMSILWLEQTNEEKEELIERVALPADEVIKAIEHRAPRRVVAARATMAQHERDYFDPTTGLFRGEACMHDGISAYPGRVKVYGAWPEPRAA